MQVLSDLKLFRFHPPMKDSSWLTYRQKCEEVKVRLFRRWCPPRPTSRRPCRGRRPGWSRVPASRTWTWRRFRRRRRRRSTFRRWNSCDGGDDATARRGVFVRLASLVYF